MATDLRPRASASRPHSSRASGTIAVSTPSRASARRVAARSRAAEVSPVSKRLSSSTSSAWAANHARCCRRNIRSASALRDTAVDESPAADAARAAVNCSSARRAAEPCWRMLRWTPSSATRNASRCSSAASSTCTRVTSISGSNTSSSSTTCCASSSRVRAAGRSPRANAVVAAVLERGGVLEPLTRRGEQLLGAGVVLVGPVHGAEREVGLRAVAEGAPLPDEITGAAELVDGSLRGPEHVGVAADQPQGMRQTDLDPPGRHPDRAVGGPLDLRQASAWTSGQHEGHAVRRSDVGAALDVPRPACAADGRAELVQRLVDVAEVAQHDARGLVGDGGDLEVGAAGDETPGSRERLVRPGQGEGQQALQVRSSRGRLRFPGHTSDLRESAVASRRLDREVR